MEKYVTICHMTSDLERKRGSMVRKRKEENDRRKSRMEGSPFDRSKVTSKPRSPGFTRSAECCTIAETRANIVSASTIMLPAFSFSWLVTAHITNVRNNTLRYNMDAGTFLAATIRHL